MADNTPLELLASQLADLDERAAAGGAPAAGDATVASLKAELDTFVAELRQRPAASEYENESACQKVTAMVQALGRDPEEVNDRTIDRSGETDNKASLTAETPLGTLGVYELLTKLGEGGMGAVYKARHTKLDKIVAIKVLPADRMKDKGAVARFEREMRAVGKLEHPNIVRAMDANVEGGMHYLVMEYVQGLDLSQLAKGRGPLPIADACELIRQAAVGLEEARENGMVHRDIKPSNLMLCMVGKKKPPVVKILDMGLALLSEAHSADVQGLTTTGQMMGTLDYMAPEQGGDSKNVDIRADIYALGASLYKLLCGEAIYHGPQYQTPVQKMMALATHPAPPIQKRRKGVPNELAAVLHRMLEKNPDKRTATPEEVAQALAPFCAGANLAALLNSAGFDVTPTPDNALSKTQPSFSQPDADTGVSQAPPKATPPLKVAKPIGPAAAASIPPVSIAPKAKPPAAPVDKTNPSLAKAPAPKPTAPASRVDQPAAPRINTSPAPVPHIHTKPTPAKAIAKTSAARKLPPWLPIAIGGGLLGFAGIAALATAIVFFFQTPNGTLRVEINDPSIEVTVKGTDIVIKKADKEEIILTPGEHALVVKRGDFTFDTRNFELKKGETTTVKVELLPGKVQVALANGAILGEKAMGTQVATVEPRLPTPGTNDPPPSTVDQPPSPGGYALEFNGQSSYVDVPTLSRDDYSPLTIEAYVTLSATPGSVVVRLEGKAGCQLYGWPSSDTQWTPNNLDARGKFQGGTPAIDVGRRYHLAMQLDENTAQLYIDGKLANSQERPAGEPTGALRGMLIGASGKGDGQTPSHAIAATIDEVRISKVVRYKQDFVPQGPFEPDADTLALYHFDEGQGDELRDSSGHKHHGKIVAAKWVRSAAAESYNGESALNFTGDGGFVEVPSLKLPRDGELTLEAYVTARKTGLGTGSKGEQIYLMGRDGTAKLAICDGRWNGYTFHNGVDDKKAAPTNERTHLALVRTASQRRLYVNGQLVDSIDDITVRPEEDSFMFQIGAKELDGVIDEVRVSNVARYDKDFTPAERFEKDDKTLALYHCDEGQGDVLNDSSGNEHHGKIVAAKWVRGAAGDRTPRSGGDNVLKFTGVDESFATGPIAFDRTKPLTLEGYFKADGKDDVNILLASLTPVTLALSHSVYVVQGSTGALGTEEHSHRPGEWVHLAAVVDGKKLRLYVDGKRATEGAIVEPAQDEPPKLTLGFHALLEVDEVRVSQAARYDADFTPAARFEPDEQTLALYHCDETTGTVVHDATSHKHDLTITGGGGFAARDAAPVGDQAAVARWLLENKKIGNIGFEVDGQVQHLPSVPPAPVKVRELNFHKFNNGGNILEADIPRLAVFTDLEYLDLSRMPLTDAGLASLAPLKKLKTLSVAETGLTPASVATIRAFPQLEFVVTPSTDDWLKPLAGMPTIRTLSFYRQGISPQAMEWFKQYPNLTELRIVECGVDWTSEKLAPLKDCKQLSKLELSYVPVDDTSVDILCDLKGLVQLTVIATNLTEAGLKKIAAALPKCRIVLKEEDRVLAPTAPPAASGASALRCTEPGGVEVPSLKLPETGPLTLETYCTMREGAAKLPKVLLGSRYLFSLTLGRSPGGKIPGDVFVAFGKGKNAAGDSNQYGIAAAPNSPEVGRTYHVAGVRTGEEFLLFIDGKKVAACPAVSSRSELFKIGDGCPVDLREIRVSKVARYSADFTPAARFEPDAETLALYHCDEGKGNVLRDASGNKHDGEIIGAKWIQATDASSIGANSGVFRNSLGMEFVRVPQGSAWLGGSGGNAGGRHVKFDADFYLGRYEVTQAQWLAVMGNNPSAHARSGGFRKTVQQFSDADLARFPVDSVSWDDCQSFLAALNAKEQVAGWTYRLPTEAEWEYACRGGPMNEQSESGFDFYVGQPTIKLLAEQANWANTLQRTTFVGSYPANRLGLYDMHGNVHEWCHEQIPDPRYREGPTASVYRGGCFHDENPHFVRAAFRAPYKPTFRGMNVGLRLARVPSQAKNSAASGSINVLPLIDPAIDAGGDGGKREGNEIVVGHRSTLALPLSMAGGWELRGEFTVSAGPKILSVVCPIAGKASSIILSESDNEAGYAGCGISGIDGLPAIDTRNPSHNAAKLVEADKRHALVITASSAGDQVTLRATVDGKTLADWTGGAARLNAVAANSTSQISFGSYKGMLRLHTLQLTMLDGEAQRLRP